MPSQRPRKKRAPARRPRPWLPVAIVGAAAVLAVVLIVVFSNVGGSSSTDLGPATTPGATHAAAQSANTIGSDSAAVTMVEYFRFDCSHCRDFASEVEPQLEQSYIDSGELRIEFRPMALESGGDILNASEAAFCAGDQGRFWEYHDLVFANFGRGFSTDNLKGYASDLGLDTKAFNSCLDSGKYKDQVTATTKDAIAAGVNSTPTFFIGKTSDMNKLSVPYPNQNELSGVQPTNPSAPFKTAIDEILATVQ
jgi:protein-disulfide isomerase